MNFAGVLSQSSSIRTVSSWLCFLASTSLDLPPLNFVRHSLPWANTALLCTLPPCMTPVQLLVTSVYYLELATNHHLSLLAKMDHFVLNTDGTPIEFIRLKSKLSRWNSCNIIGKRALILSIVGHEKKSELNIQQYVRKQMVFSSRRAFISISADLSGASLNSWARLFCRTYVSVKILKNLLKAIGKDREWVPKSISPIPIFLKYGSYTGLPAFVYFARRLTYLVCNPSCITGEVSTY